jgi:hypothetical protein
MTESSDQIQTYPSVEWAYDYVQPSDNWMLARLQAADARIQGVQTLSASFTFGIPVVVKALNPAISFQAGRLYLAILCFAALMIIGLIGQARGGVILANPAVLYKEWLLFSEWEFKKTAVYWSGEHFELNGKHIQTKARSAVVMTALFITELVFMFAWLATS